MPAKVTALIIQVPLNRGCEAFRLVDLRASPAVAVVESYVRVGIVAIGVGAALLALLV